jgi:serine/threonine protein kinase
MGGMSCQWPGIYPRTECGTQDIKPANILTTNGHVRFADFGISRTINAEDNENKTYSLPGPYTALYCAPEVAAWDRRGRKADVFSLGCVFVEMTTIGLRLSLENFSRWRETDGTRAYHRTLERTLRCLLLLRKHAMDRVAYCIAMLNPDPDECISSGDLVSWTSCQRDYASAYCGNLQCDSLGNSPVGEFWSICLHALPNRKAENG